MKQLDLVIRATDGEFVFGFHHSIYIPRTLELLGMNEITDLERFTISEIQNAVYEAFLEDIGVPS